MTAFLRAAGDPASRRQLAASLTCADIVDALGRRHRHRAHLRDLTSPTHTFGALFDQAIGTGGADKVLVLASNDYAETSVGGGTKLVRLEHHRLAGLLTDARLRDFTELSGYSFAAYCSGKRRERES